MGVLAPLREVTAEQWAQLFATNVTGASLVTAAAAPHLAAAAGSAVYLSSLSASYTTPWPMLGAYAVTKSALDKLVEAWRTEHPEIGFTRLAVGDSLGGPVTRRPSSTRPGIPMFWRQPSSTGWSNKSHAGGLVDAEHLTDVVNTVIRCGKAVSFPI